MLRLVARLGGIVGAGLRILAVQLAQRFKSFLFLGIFRRARSAPASRDLIDLLLQGHALHQVRGALFGGEIRIAIGWLGFLRKTNRKKQTDENGTKQILPKMNAASSCYGAAKQVP